MVHKITWSPEAIATYIGAIEYLEKEWSEKEIRNFRNRVTDKLQLLLVFPKIGRTSDLKKNIFRTVIHKRITLVYQYKPLKKEIELVTFWNNWQDSTGFKY